MASFNLFGGSTTAQTLGSGENGFVGTAGNLVVNTTDAITISASADLVVLGAVVGTDGNAVGGAAESVDLTIGATGQIVSTGNSGIDLLVSGVLNIGNAGLVSAVGAGMNFQTSDAGSTLRLNNSGTISGGFRGLTASHANGTVQISNAGLIESRLEDTAISAFGSFVQIANSGTIHGDVRIEGTSSSAILRNTGVIHGDVTFAGSGTIDTRGGFVTGLMRGGEGSNVFHVDRGDLDIQDLGTSGIDTILSSVSFTIALGIEELFLTGGADARAIGSRENDSLVGNAGDNRITGHEGDDTLAGAAGDDTLRGGAGNDTLSADRGDDRLVGGEGIDTVSFSGVRGPVTVNLANGVAKGVASDDDTIIGIENVIGSTDNDSISGSATANSLAGGNGNDVIAGGSGNDSIEGGGGADTLRGGGGADQFVYLFLSASTPVTTDTISDFSVAQGDRIDLSFIDPDPGVNDQFVFNGATFLPVGLPSVRVFQDVANNLTVVEARTTADDTVDIRIHLTGLLNLTADSFLL